MRDFENNIWWFTCNNSVLNFRRKTVQKTKTKNKQIKEKTTSEVDSVLLWQASSVFDVSKSVVGSIIDNAFLAISDGTGCCIIGTSWAGVPTAWENDAQSVMIAHVESRNCY